MDKLSSFFRKYARLEVAFMGIVALQITVVVLQQLDLPLQALTPAESKLDFHSSYDVSTVQRIFEAYGQKGRTIYAWDLLVDTFYPLLLGSAAILVTLLVIRNARWQTLLILFPLVFMAADVLENIFFLIFLWTFPSLSPALVGIANVFTRIKLFTINIAFLELYLFVILIIILFVARKLKTAVLALASK